MTVLRGSSRGCHALAPDRAFASAATPGADNPEAIQVITGDETFPIRTRNAAEELCLG